MKNLAFKRNVQARVVKGHLLLRIDLSAQGKLSKSGKTTVIASTLGVAKVPGHDDMRIGLNVYRKAAA